MKGKLFKLSLVFLMLLIVSSFAFADFTTDNQVYYNMENSSNIMVDQSPNNRNGTAFNGVIFNNDTISKFSIYEGINDYSTIPYNLPSGSDFTLSYWVNQTALEDGAHISMGSLSSDSIAIAFRAGDSDFVYDINPSGGFQQIGTGTYTTNQWYHVVMIYDAGNTVSTYVNNVSDGSWSAGSYSWTPTNFQLAHKDGAGSYQNIKLTNVAIYNRTLNSTEVSNLYAEGRSYSPYEAIANFTIQARDALTLDSINTFNATVNGTFYNTTTGTITLPYLLTDGYVVNITVEADNYDTGTYNNYNISTALVADLNISLIDIAIVGREVITNETVTNFTINSTFYNAETTNGTINISLPKDSNLFNITNSLGYYNKTNFEFNVSQMQYTYYVYFNNVKLNITALNLVTNTSISNFTIDLLYLDNGTYDETNSTLTGNIYYENLIDGLYNATIDAEGFELQTVQLNLTNLSESYEFELFTTNSINITFRDELTNNIITENIIVEFISPTQSYNFSTTDGYLYVDLLSPEGYNIRYSSTNYTTRYYYFQLTNRTYNELTLYLLEDTSTDLITVTVIDQEANSLEGALVKSLKYDITTNTYILQQSIATDSNGQAVFSVRIGEEFYYFIVEYPAGTQLKQTSPSLIYSDTVLIQVQTEAPGGTSWQNTLGINHNITWYNDTNEFTFRYNDGEGTVSEGCFYIYDSRYNGKTLLNSTCASGAANTLTLGVDGAEGSYYIAKAYVKINGGYTLIEELQQVIPLAGIYNYTSLFFVAILLLAFAMTAIKTGPAAVVLLPMIGLMGVKLMGLLSGYVTWGTVFSLSIVAIIIAVLLKRRTGI